MATVGPSVRTGPDGAGSPAVEGAEARPAPAGPAHVAVVSFLASRVVPSGGFWVALAGGIALARVAERRGARIGFGASTAAMLETVAIIGPLRFAVPFTQAVTAPLLGRFEARGMAAWLQVAICALLRLLQNAVQTAFYILVLAGGIDAVTGTYDRIAGIAGLEVDDTRAVVITLTALVAWSAFASVVQVLVYRRGLSRWDGLDAAAATDAPELPADRTAGPDERAPRRPRFDPRLLALVAIAFFAVLLASTEWVVLGAVAVALALAWIVSRPERGPLRAGLAFAALLAGSVLLIALVGGLGPEVALRRAARAALLVMTATWLRAAATSPGLRFAFRRALHHLRRIPSVPEASRVLDSLESEGRLVASGRAFAEAIEDVPTRPVPFTDAVIGWVVAESRRHGTDAPAVEPPESSSASTPPPAAAARSRSIGR